MEKKINLTTTKKKVKKVAYIKKAITEQRKKTRVQDTHYFEFAFNTVIMCNELNYGM